MHTCLSHVNTFDFHGMYGALFIVRITLNVIKCGRHSGIRHVLFYMHSLCQIRYDVSLPQTDRTLV